MKLFLLSSLCLAGLCCAQGVAAADRVLDPIDPAGPVTARGSVARIFTNGDFAVQNPAVSKPSLSGARAMSKKPAFVMAPAEGTGDSGISAYSQDIQNIVRACGGDPVRLFNLVRNEVSFQPYRGFRKGPVLTWQTRSGSDADQAWLLVELLRAAGYDAWFYYGIMTLPQAEAFNWWGADNLGALNIMTGSSGYSAGATGDGGYAIEQICAAVTVNGATYYLVPGFKGMAENEGIDLAAASGYSRDAM